MFAAGIRTPEDRGIHCLTGYLRFAICSQWRWLMDQAAKTGRREAG